MQLRARWYQPGSGQFVSRDPFAGLAASPQSLNPYAYAHNDPANRTDPTGMFAGDLIGDIAALFGADDEADNLASTILGRLSGPLTFCPDGSAIFGLLLLTAPTFTDLDAQAIAAWADRFVRSLPVAGAAAGGAAGAAGATGAAAVPTVVVVVAAAAAVLLLAGFAYLAYQNGQYISSLGPPPAPQTDSEGRTVPSPGPAPCPLDANGKPNCGPATSTKETADEAVESYRGLDGDEAKDKSHFRKPLYSPSQFRVDSDGVSTFELPYLPGNKPYAVGFLLAYKKPKGVGTRAVIASLPECIATYTPQYGEGHWSINCSSSDTKARLSEYAKVRGAILNPHWAGTPQERRLP